MRNINYFDKELSVEEYVKKEVCKNAGTQSVAFKEQLISLCSSAGIECNEKMKKEELFDLLCNNGFEYKQFADLFGIGVSSQVYQLSLIHNGVLKKVGKYRFRAFGKYNYAPLYDLYQYAQMTDDAMEDMLKK